MMLVVGADGTAKVSGEPAPAKARSGTSVVGVAFAVVLFLGGAAMLAFALLKG
jgi:hypothetical protein